MSAIATTHRNRPRRPAAKRVSRAWMGELPAQVDLLPDGELMRAQYDNDRRRYAARLPWTRASLVLAELPGYLDRMFGEIYRVQANPPRPVPASLREQILVAWPDDQTLIELFFLCPSFPVKHPAVSCGRYNDKFAQNPIIAGQIAQMIRQLGPDRALEAAEAPLDPTKQLGPAYQQYMVSRWEIVPTFDEMQTSPHPVTMLGVGDQQAKAIGREHFGYRGRKGYDTVARVSTGERERYFGMEAKFISGNGGGQNLQIDNALSLSFKSDRYDVQAAAVIDGVALFSEFTGAAKERIRASKTPVLSALLLDAFFQSHLDELAGLNLTPQLAEMQRPALRLVG